MELGVQLEELILGVGFSSVVFFLIAFPPQEFISAGATIPSIFHFIVGDEKLNFIEFHLRRTILTMVIHVSMIPGCLLALHIYGSTEVFTTHPETIIHYVAHAALLFAVASYSYIFYITRDKYRRHSLMRNLRQFNGNVDQIVQSINSESRNLANLYVRLVGYSRLLITESWIIKVSNYTVVFIPASNVDVQVIEAHMAPCPPLDGGAMQFVHVLFKNNLHDISVSVRINSTLLSDIRERLDRPIHVAADLVIYRSISDQFVTAFADVVQRNPTVALPERELGNLDLCLGCSSSSANVTLSKQCLDVPHEPNCEECRCRPMWCVTCMARVFAAKQNKDNTETWLGGKANCPTCRSIFCVLDVCFIQQG
uniref:Transmembrane protein n=1 Tax=Steinernema glaseri TaxID=37863 RepID=A0A1I7YZ84_9BILA